MSFGGGLMGTENMAYAQKAAMDVPYNWPIAAQLRRRLEEAEQQIVKIRALLDLLEKNPSIEQFIDLSRGMI